METRRLPGLGRRAEPRPAVHRLGRHRSGSSREAWMRLQDRARIPRRRRFRLPRFLRGGAGGAGDRAGRPLSVEPPHPRSTRRPTPTGVRRRRREPAWCWPSNPRDHPLGRLDGARRSSYCPIMAARRTTSPTRIRRAARWRMPFIRMPYAREITVPRAIINDTFETAITWDRFEAFHDRRDAARRGGDEARRPETAGEVTDPLHPRLSGRTGAVYYTFQRARRSRPADRAMASHQDARLRRPDRRRRHDHTPPRGRPRPYALVSRAAPRPVRRGARAAKRALDPAGMHEPGRARSVAALTTVYRAARLKGSWSAFPGCPGRRRGDRLRRRARFGLGASG